MRMFLKVIGWLFVALGVLGGGLQLVLMPHLTNLLVLFFWIGLGYYCITYKKKPEGGTPTPEAKPAPEAKAAPTGSKLFAKAEMEKLIASGKRLGDALRHSRVLAQVGGGRADKMYQTMLSYICILAYAYEHWLHYGKAADMLDTRDLQHRYMLSLQLVFGNPQAMRQCLSQLPANWQDVVTVTEAATLAGEAVGEAVSPDEIDALTEAFAKLAKHAINTEQK